MDVGSVDTEVPLYYAVIYEGLDPSQMILVSVGVLKPIHPSSSNWGTTVLFTLGNKYFFSLNLL